jgi:hypothetical protein
MRILAVEGIHSMGKGISLLAGNHHSNRRHGGTEIEVRLDSRRFMSTDGTGILLFGLFVDSYYYVELHVTLYCPICIMLSECSIRDYCYIVWT